MTDVPYENYTRLPVVRPKAQHTLDVIFREAVNEYRSQGRVGFTLMGVSRRVQEELGRVTAVGYYFNRDGLIAMVEENRAAWQ